MANSKVRRFLEDMPKTPAPVIPHVPGRAGDGADVRSKLFLRWPLLIPSVLLLTIGGAPAVAAAVSVRSAVDVPYTFLMQRPQAGARQSLDVFVPVGVAKPPLVVFVHGGFWVEADDNYRIGRGVAEALTAQGAAVALVRYRLAPGARHPAQAEDVAAAVAFLKRSAERYGYDPDRVYLAGHSAGAHLTALVALDPRYLRTHGLSPRDLAGVIAFSGIYDLSPAAPALAGRESLLASVFGNDAAVRRAAAPMTHAARSAPPFLILAAANDFPGFQIDARRFARALRTAGAPVVDDAVLAQTDHFTLVRLAAPRNVALQVVAGFLKLKPLDPLTESLLTARRAWQTPPFSTEPFWDSGVPVRSYDMTPAVRTVLTGLYEYNAWELRAFPLKKYHAIDLLEYLDRLPPEQAGSGEHIVLTNVRGEKIYWRRSEIAPYRPQLVIGIDDERNLFRLAVFYQHKLEYSWKPQRPPLMARPLGAFVHFEREPPPALRPDTGAMYALTPQAFRRYDADPLASVKALPGPVRDVLTTTNRCLSCHSFQGAGARSGHVTAAGGAAHGGFALPLESYPETAWRRFIFDPAAASALIGVRPNPVPAQTAQLLYDTVLAAAKESQSQQPQ